MKTSPIISFGKNETAISKDASISSTGAQSFCTLDDLKTGAEAIYPYATYEPDFWLLDGQYKFLPADLADAHAGFMSTDMSDSTSDHGSVPLLQVQFTEVFSTNGLTLRFQEYSGDYPDSIRIRFFNAALSVIQDDTYTPTSTTFETNQSVTDFKRIWIDFNSTNKSYRYARLKGIDFDDIVRFTGADVKEARIIEELDPLSITLRSNTLELKLFSSTGAFNIINPTGLYASLQENYPIEVHERIGDADIIYLGRYYLKEWNSLSENMITLNATDAIGLLDSITYLGRVYDPNEIATHFLIEEILTTAADVEYELDASLADIGLLGFLPIGSCRNALQQICFVIGAYVTCARSDVIQIKPMELASELTTYDHEITSAEKGINSSVELKPLVTGVEITAHNYLYQDITDYEIYNGTLGVGTHRIIFDEPVGAAPLNGASTATVTDYDLHNNWLDITISVEGTVIIDKDAGIRDVERIFGVYTESLPAETKQNVLSFDAQMIDFVNAPDIAQRVYDYYQQRFLIKTRLYASFVAIGDSVLVDTQDNRQLAGIVEKMSTDLSGGMISDTEIIGIVVPE
jgi:hypothetical protein